MFGGLLPGMQRDGRLPMKVVGLLMNEFLK